MVEADHKPLESLFKKTQSIWHRSAFSEHERMMLRTGIQQYKLMVKYRPGDQLHIADTLSRASQMESTSQADEFEVHLLLGISKEKVDQFKRETDTHPVLRKAGERSDFNHCNRFHKNHELAVYISKFHDLMNQKP